MDDLDEDGSGTIDIEEFTKLMKNEINKRDPKEELVKVFKTYDEDNSNKITWDNLRRVADELK
jgi:centrin-1